MDQKIPKNPLKLTIEEQRKIFQIGDKVYIRPDASKYFSDITDPMLDMVEKWVNIIDISLLKNIYNEPDEYITTEYNENDLLLRCEYNHNDWWWYYKCVYTDKYIDKPSYEPKNKINRKLNEGSIHPNYKWNTIIIKFDNEQQYNKAFDKLKNFDNNIKSAYNFHINLLSEGPIYIRFSSIGDNLYYGGYSLLSDLDDIYNKTQYEKVFNYMDVNLDLLNQIKNKGFYLDRPSYEPKSKIIRNKKLLEKKNLHNDYLYNCIVISVTNKEDGLFLINYLNDKYDLSIKYLLSDMDYYLLKYNNNMYIRLFFDDYNKLQHTKGGIEYLDSASRALNYKYHKIYTVDDVKKGLIENILNKGIPFLPSYEPKSKIIRESYQLKNRKDYEYVCIYAQNNDEVIKIQNILFENGYKWSGNNNLILLYEEANTLIYCVSKLDMLFILSRSNESEESFYESIQRNNLCPRLFKFTEINEYLYYLKHGIIGPSYKPKQRPIRESNQPYESINIHARNNDEIIKIQEILFKNDYIWGNGEKKLLFTYQNDLVFLVQKNDKKILQSGNIEQFNDMKDYIYRRFKSDPILYTLDNLNDLKSILKIQPSYKPKSKIIRENIQNYPYKFIIVELKNIYDLKKFVENVKFINGVYRDDNYHFLEERVEKQPIFLTFKIINNKIEFHGWSRMTYFNQYIIDFNVKYEKLFQISDVENNLFNKIYFKGEYKTTPDYNPKYKIIRENYLHPDYYYDSIVIVINDKQDLEKLIQYSPDAERLQSIIYVIGLSIDDEPFYIRYYIESGKLITAYSKLNFLSTNIFDFTYEKLYTVEDLKNGIIDKIIKDGKYIIEPTYKPKQKIVREDMITKLNDFLLEKSSLTALGVPSEVMKSIQSDLAIPSDAKWNRIRLKKDIINIIDNINEVLIIQIGLDSIDVLVSYGNEYNKQYFIDSYILEDEMDWGGGYNKLPRKTLSKNQFLISIEPKKMLYHLQDEFSIKKQHHRKIFKKEKSFEEFTNNFKKDFLKNFDSILRRIVGQNFKDAKNDVLDKAKKIEVENKMIISGLDNPLKGANSLTILDEMIYQFEDEYSKYFDERLDIQEMSELFTRDKVLTAFMYFVYTGKIMLT